MAATFAQASALHKKKIDVFDDAEFAMWSTTPNVAGDCDTVEAANLYENQEAIAGSVRDIRFGFSALFTPAYVRDKLLPELLEWNVTIGAAEARNTDYPTAERRIRDYMVANSKTINSRGISYGAVSAVTGTGTGTIRRLTVDDEGFSLEKCHTETKTFTCVRDQSNVEKHFEEFRVDGATAYRDGLKRTGSGLVRTLTARTTRDSARYISNPSFNQYGGTTQPTAGSEQTPTTVTSIVGWTLDATTNVKTSLGPSDASYRDLVGEPTATRLTVKFTGNASISQVLNENQNPQFTQEVPYYLQVAVYRGSNCDGTLTLTLGATTRAVAMSTLTSGQWNVVTLTMNKGLYPRNFRTNNMTVGFALSSWSTGYLHLDDAVFCHMDLMDGTWWTLVGGATPFVKGDYFTAADSESGRAARSYWQFRAYIEGVDSPFSWPSDNSGSETEVDP